jgi:TatD DNase family protein
MLFDTHVHVDDFVSDGSWPEVLDRARLAGVEKMIAVGGGPDANALAVRLAQQFPGRLFAAVGYDRHLAGTSPDMEQLERLADSTATVAIGEIGLDYFYDAATAPEQRRLFIRCLEIATQFRKPVLVHTRDADADTLALLTDFSKAWKGDADRLGAVHCFTRDRAVAYALLDLGFYISFSGIVTFANASALRETAALIPEERLLIETDAPYLAPVPHRGQRCEPAFVAETAKRLAQVLGTTVESLAIATARNAERLFQTGGETE